MGKDKNPYTQPIEDLGKAYNLHGDAIKAGNLSKEQVLLMERLASEGKQISPEALAKFTVTNVEHKKRTIDEEKLAGIAKMLKW